MVVLAFLARKPSSILRNIDPPTEALCNEAAPRETPSQKPRKKATLNRVRFSPEKKERLYNVKTGEIVGESTVLVKDID